MRKSIFCTDGDFRIALREMLRLRSATEPKGNFTFPFFLSTSAPLHCAWLVSLPNHSEQKIATINSALRLRSGTRCSVETVRAPSNTRKINIFTSIGARSASTNRQEIHRHNIVASIKQKSRPFRRLLTYHKTMNYLTTLPSSSS